MVDQIDRLILNVLADEWQMIDRRIESTAIEMPHAEKKKRLAD